MRMFGNFGPVSYWKGILWMVLVGRGGLLSFFVKLSLPQIPYQKGLCLEDRGGGHRGLFILIECIQGPINFKVTQSLTLIECFLFWKLDNTFK